MIYNKKYLPYYSIIYRNIESIMIEYQIIIEYIYGILFEIYNDRIKEFIIFIYNIY
jgi:hypothetical protein